VLPTPLDDASGDYHHKIKEVIISTVSVKPALYNEKSYMNNSNEHGVGTSTA